MNRSNRRTPGRPAAWRILAACAAFAACVDPGWPSPPDVTLDELVAATQEWRQWRRDDLVTPPFGPVLWIGLWELPEGATPLGSDTSLAIALPREDAPPFAGALVRSGQEVRIDPAPGAGFRREDGAQVTGSLALSHDLSEHPTQLALGSLGLSIHAERGTDRLWLRAWDEDTPLRETFALPEAYPVDPAWRVAARFDPFPEARNIPVADVTGGIVTQPVPGELVFRLRGREHRLLAAVEPNSTTYFIMLWDSTALTTTYEAGRYVRAPLADSTGWTVLDFNRTYNPPCVFSPYSVCGFPPQENRLDLPITAGERRASSPVAHP